MDITSIISIKQTTTFLVRTRNNIAYLVTNAGVVICKMTDHSGTAASAVQRRVVGHNGSGER